MLGLCHLLQMPDNPAIAAHATQLVPSLILLFDGLKRAYAARNEEAGLPDVSLDGFSGQNGTSRITFKAKI